MDKIIVLQQQSHGAEYFFARALQGSRFTINDFDLHESPEACEKAILSDIPQLLIVGSIDGQSSKGDSFIKKVKKKNSQLRVIGYTSSGVMHHCDIFVDKRPMGSNERLHEAIHLLKQQPAVM